MKRIVFVTLITLLLVCILPTAFDIRSIKGEWVGAVYIRANGDVDPPDAPIMTSDKITYTLVGNITSTGDGIVVERDNILIDGAGFVVNITWVGHGIHLLNVYNVTIENFNIIGSVEAGPGLEWQVGIYVRESSCIKIAENNATKNMFAILLVDSRNVEIAGNSLFQNSQAIRLDNCSNIIISQNNILSNDFGLFLERSSSYNRITGNHIINNTEGVLLSDSKHNKIIGNTIAYNGLGIELQNSSTNIIFHNNFDNNEQQVYDFSSDYPWLPPSINKWSDSYPSGGNYWSDYEGIDIYCGPNQNQPGSDGIGDTAYVIDENNADYYPLMGLLSKLKVSPEQAFDIISNSTIKDFQYNELGKTLILHVSNKTSEQTCGFCRITIPHALISPSYNVAVNDVPIPYSTIFENETLSIIYFTYEHSIVEIKITQSPPTYTLTISTTFGGTTNPAPGIYTYSEGTEVSVTAIPSVGFSFSHWLLNGSVRIDNPISVMMNANYILEAYFIDDIPPQISQPIQQPPPDEVQPGQEVHVWVNVTDLGTGIKNVTLWYVDHTLI